MERKRHCTGHDTRSKRSCRDINGLTVPNLNRLNENIEHGTKCRLPLNKDPLQPFLTWALERCPSQKVRDGTPASQVQPSSALVQLPPKPNAGLSPPAGTLPGTGVPCGTGKRHLESSPNWSCWPVLPPPGLCGPRRGHPTAPQPPLTVAVGEVEVSLGTGITVLPGVIGFAVTAAGEVLAGAIGEVRLTVAACGEGRAGCHKRTGTWPATSTTEASLRHRASVRDPPICCKSSPKTKSAVLPLQKGSGSEGLLPLCSSHCRDPSKAAQPRSVLQEIPVSLERWQWHTAARTVQNSRCVTGARPSWAPQRYGYNPLLPRNPCLGAWRAMLCKCQLKGHKMTAKTGLPCRLQQG